MHYWWEGTKLSVLKELNIALPDGPSITLYRYTQGNQKHTLIQNLVYKCP